jgi:hypothetical protein
VPTSPVAKPNSIHPYGLPASVDTSNPAICGRVKTGHLSAVQNPVRSVRSLDHHRLLPAAAIRLERLYAIGQHLSLGA